MGMHWQVGSMHLDFNDVGARGAYQPRHAVSRRRHQPRRGLADEVGRGAARAKGYVHHQAAASCQSYGFAPPVSIKQLLLDRAVNLVDRAVNLRLHRRQVSRGQVFF